MTWLAAGATLALLAVSALLSAAEEAAFSLHDSRVRTLKDEGFAGAPELGALRARPDGLQSALQLMVTLLNALAVGTSVAAGALSWGLAGAFLSLLVALLAVLLLGEVAPRALAARRPIRVALTAAPLLAAVQRWAGALLSPVRRMEDVLFGRHETAERTPEEREVLELSELGQEEGIVDLEEHLLVERAFRLDELAAWDVMTPRVDVFAWKDSLTLEEVVGELPTVPYSRVPVYGDTVDDVTGILYVREAYQAYVGGRRDVPLSRLSREPFFVPGSLSLSHLLRAFQTRRIHMGIVADEFGGTDGLVTLEDVLEELVGEIVDETDVAEDPLLRISRNELVADAAVDLREINYAFNVSLPQLEHRSLNGFILEELGHVPLPGESFERDGIRIEVLDATETQVLRARIQKVSTGEEEEDDDGEVGPEPVREAAADPGAGDTPGDGLD